MLSRQPSGLRLHEVRRWLQCRAYTPRFGSALLTGAIELRNLVLMRLIFALASLLLALLGLSTAVGQSDVTDPVGDFFSCTGELSAEGPAVADIVGASATLDGDEFRWTVELAEALSDPAPPGTNVHIVFGIIDPRMPVRLVGYNRQLDLTTPDRFRLNVISLDEGVNPRLPGELSVEGATLIITTPAAAWDVNSPEDARGFIWTVGASARVGGRDVCDFMEEREPAYEVAGVAPGPGPTPPPDTTLTATPEETPSESASDDDGGVSIWLVAVAAVVAAIVLAGVSWWWLARRARR